MRGVPGEPAPSDYVISSERVFTGVPGSDEAASLALSVRSGRIETVCARARGRARP